MPERIAVLIIADVRLYREGLAANLGARPGLLVVGTAKSREAALATVESACPDVVVLDMATRDSLDIARAITLALPSAKIIAFALEETERGILACAEAGVAAWIGCDGSIEDLVSTISTAVAGEFVCSPQATATLLRGLAAFARGGAQPGPGSILTVREREVAALLDRGLSNKEIAQRLHVEVATVKNHVHNILEKLRVRSRSEAAARLHTSSPAQSPRALLASGGYVAV